MRHIILFLSLLALIAPAYALESSLEYLPDYVIINSDDWREVYSGMLFSQHIGLQGNFLVSPEHAIMQADIIPVTVERVLLIETDNKYYGGYEGLIRSKGFDAMTVSTDDNLNLLLGGYLDTSKFIVISDAFGFNAISVASYALMSGSYVIFANRDNIDDVKSFLDGNVDELMIYGSVDTEVREELAEFDPIVIDTGGRISNNLEINKRFLSQKETKQVWVVSGDKIYRPLFSDDYPTLFIGRTTIPLEIDQFIEENGITSLVLIGNDMAGLMTQFKSRYESRTDKEILVNMLIGRSPRKIDFSGDRIEAIDMFDVPMPRLDINVSSIFYNQLTGQLEVTYENIGDAPLYFLSTITINDGGERKTLGDGEARFLSGGRIIAISYPVEILNEDASGSFSVVFGEDRRSLDSAYTYNFDELEFIRIEDSSDVMPKRAKYDRLNNALYITVENIGPVAAFADIEVDLLLDGVSQTLFAPEIIEIAEGTEAKVVIRQRLTSLDLDDNEFVKVRVRHSQRENMLLKVVEEDLPLEIIISPVLLSGAACCLLILILIIIFYRRRKKANR